MIPGRYQTARSTLLLALALLASAAMAGLLARRADPLSPPDSEGPQERDRRMDRRLREHQEYMALKDQLGEDLLARRCTLAEAVGRLARTANGCDASWRANLRLVYPGCADEECLAANLVDYTIASRAADPPAARRAARQLEAQFRAAYGRAAPWLYLRSGLGLGGGRRSQRSREEACGSFPSSKALP